jgi:hypothetical protein
LVGGHGGWWRDIPGSKAAGRRWNQGVHGVFDRFALVADDADLPPSLANQKARGIPQRG